MTGIGVTWPNMGSVKTASGVRNVICIRTPLTAYAVRSNGRFGTAFSDFGKTRTGINREIRHDARVIR
jgi:hypothetical protein